jgi:2-succinyl-5-enolpyruvyl-6-hydroxy-3-cyclohexene-1-carboxylate synthase
MSSGNVNLTWARALLDELIAAGLRHVVLSPGARSAPLALAVSERNEIEAVVSYDERSAAYVALGIGRVDGIPAALVCTSGTAAANYLPAVVEAFYDNVPLILLTADRPSELRETGAWQTIRQADLYRSFVRWEVDLPAPEDSQLQDAQSLRYVRHVAARAMAVSSDRPAGPVHLNVAFREPLLPQVVGEVPAETHLEGSSDLAAQSTSRGEETPDELGGEGAAVPSGAAGRVHGTVRPVVRRVDSLETASPETVEALAQRILAEPRGLILAGRTAAYPSRGYAEALAALAAATGYPLLAETTGGLRFGPHDRTHVVAAGDAVLRADAWIAGHRPRLAIRFGRSFAWRQVTEFLAQSAREAGIHQVVIDPHRTWDDPARLGGDLLTVDPAALARALVDALREHGGPGSDASRSAWLEDWLTADRAATEARAAVLAEAGAACTGWVHDALPSLLGDGAVVMAANSMAVRDLESFAGTSDRRLQVFANRGAAGIDGTLSTAAGLALASRRPVVLLTGDIAFAHDLSGLAAASEAASSPRGLDLVVIVLNDQGGGIFEYLPLAALPPRTFERYFLVKPDLDIGRACAAFGVPHGVVTDLAGLASVVSPQRGVVGVRVAEVPVERALNTRMHRRYWAKLAAALER